jgi:AAA family ATP:ADP antiporter
MICSFCISAEHAVIRPVSNAVFMTAYGSHFFPWVWMAVVPLNFLVVELYNRFLPRFGCRKIFMITAGLVMGINLLGPSLLKKWFFFPFLFYCWKEIYVLLMFQQLWSVIHSMIKLEQAKYLYGLFFTVGGLGGVLGSFLPGFLAVQLGSENFLYMGIPFYCVLILGFLYLLAHSHESIKREWDIKKGSIKEGIRLIAGSKVLIFILFIVVFMQISSTILYYQINHTVELTILDKDLRTEFFGKILGLGSILTVILQCAGSFLLIHFLGLKLSHFCIPCILCVNALGCLLFPLFSMVSYAYVTIKAFDFSIFTILKEMLYIPLSKEEKFQAKAFIDVFAYRSSKALASFLILGFQFIQAPFSLLSWISVVICLAWCWVVTKMPAEKAVSKEPA